MITGDTTKLTTRHKKKATSLREAIMNSLKKKLDCEGFEVARKWFDSCCANFSCEDDWPSIYIEAYNYIFESKKKIDEQEHQRQLDMNILNGISKGGGVGQLNYLIGSNPLASYCSTKVNMEEL